MSDSTLNPITISLIDDDFIIISLLKEFLNQDEQFLVKSIHTDALEFLEHSKENHTNDILILDLKMKTIDGLEVIQRLKDIDCKIKIIVMSSHYEPSTVGFMLKQGVAAFLSKGSSPHDLKKIIKHVAEHGYYFTLDQMNHVRENISNKAPQPQLADDQLTEREKEIIILLCQQKSAKDIGEILYLSPRTIEGYKSNLLLKVGVKNVAGLIIYALQNRIVNLADLPAI